MKQELQTSSSIFPFIHPILIHKAASFTSFAREGEEGSPHKLPTVGSILALQKARDELIEEVLRFDNGDLGRMREKTRSESRNV